MTLTFARLEDLELYKRRRPHDRSIARCNRGQKRNEAKRRVNEVAAESWTAIPSSSTEYRLAERLRIARVGGVDFWNGVEEAERKTRGSRLLRKVREGRRKATSLAGVEEGGEERGKGEEGAAEALSHSFYRAKRRRRRQRERRLSIFTSNEFELKTTPPLVLPPPPPAPSRPRPPPSCLDHAATLCSTNHANHCAA